MRLEWQQLQSLGTRRPGHRQQHRTLTTASRRLSISSRRRVTCGSRRCAWRHWHRSIPHAAAQTAHSTASHAAIASSSHYPAAHSARCGSQGVRSRWAARAITHAWTGVDGDSPLHPTAAASATACSDAAGPASTVTTAAWYSVPPTRQEERGGARPGLTIGAAVRGAVAMLGDERARSLNAKKRADDKPWGGGWGGGCVGRANDEIDPLFGDW